MEQEQKELLLKDLCARLPYGVVVKDRNGVHKLTPTNTEFIDLFNGKCNIKPYLFPLSSMTDKMWDKEFDGCGITEFTRDSFKYDCETMEFNNNNPQLSSIVKFTNKLIKNHFDIYGFIPMGLAIDATNLKIY